jgi:hypothetical protein
MFSKINSVLIVKLLTIILFSTSINAQTVINNNNLRFGDGSENSINDHGLLKQPFYYNQSSSDWRKLTYRDYPLDVRFGIDGDGSNNWNINGTVVGNPLLANITFDYSGMTYAAGNSGDAYGIAIVSGNITINGKLFLVENKYTLLQNEGYIKMQVKLTNLSSSTVQNVRVWYGTRDDYVGGTDSPTKERGKIENNQFQMIGSPSEPSNVLKIRTSTEAVLFYSNSNRAFTSIASCCTFTYATESNPLTNSITATNDGSYAMYTRFNDLDPNESDEITIYYAAGTLADIDDIIESVAQAAQSVFDITQTTAKFSYSVSQNGTSNYIIVPKGSTAPTEAQIVAGNNYTGVTVAANGSFSSTANITDTIPTSGLSVNTEYTVHVVTLYNNGTSNVFTAIESSDFTTAANDDPTGSTISNQSFCINSTQSGIPITITDAYPVVGNYNLSGSSSNNTLINSAGITFGGTGSNRTINLTPNSGQTGTATITINFNDGVGGTGSQNFNITVLPYGGICTPPRVLINPHITIKNK